MRIYTYMYCNFFYFNLEEHLFYFCGQNKYYYCIWHLHTYSDERTKYSILKWLTSTKQ